MSFANGQNVQAADLNNFSVTSVTTTGAVTVGTTLGVTGLSTLQSLTVPGATTLAALTFSGTLTPQALVDISGASAGQIKFPAAQNASTNVNTLDDYEEGTWTPAIGGTGGQSGQVYTNQVGTYVKIGKLVTAYFQITLSTLGTVTTNAQITGLPFTSENTTLYRPTLHIGYWANLTSNAVYVGGFMEPNTTAALLFFTNAAATFLGNMVQGDLSNTSQLVGSITYRATA